MSLAQTHINNARVRLDSELNDIGKSGLSHSLLALAVTMLLWVLVDDMTGWSNSWTALMSLGLVLVWG